MPEAGKKDPKRNELEDYKPGATKEEVMTALGKTAKPVKDDAKKPEK